MALELLPGKYPAVVKEYLQEQRLCRVSIPGITDGGDILPLAEIEYSIGDKSKHSQYPTEIEILPGDMVWVAFHGGDPRYPIITGWRNPQVGNSVDWRRWHHANIDLIADSTILETAEDKILMTVGDSTIEMLPAKITIKVGGSYIEITPAHIKLWAPRIDLN
jgi:hypothetical protein